MPETIIYQIGVDENVLGVYNRDEYNKPEVKKALEDAMQNLISVTLDTLKSSGTSIALLRGLEPRRMPQIEIRHTVNEADGITRSEVEMEFNRIVTQISAFFFRHNTTFVLENKRFVSLTD